MDMSYQQKILLSTNINNELKGAIRKNSFTSGNYNQSYYIIMFVQRTTKEKIATYEIVDGVYKIILLVLSQIFAMYF